VNVEYKLRTYHYMPKDVKSNYAEHN
jgi:hypothetical protein